MWNWQPSTSPEEASALALGGITITTAFDPLLEQDRTELSATPDLCDRLIGIRLCSPSDAGDECLVHKNTCPGEARWRVTFFDDRGPSGHSPRPTALEALMEARASGYRAVEVITARHSGLLVAGVVGHREPSAVEENRWT